MVIKKVIEKDEIIMNYLISYCLYSVGDEFQRSTFVVSLYLNHLDPVYIWITDKCQHLFDTTQLYIKFNLLLSNKLWSGTRKKEFFNRKL